MSGDLAQALYDQIMDRTVRVSSARAAEATKLMENIFRSVNIALVNELKMIWDRMDIDVWEVLDAAETKPFGFMRFNPGPGLGGHCIPIDPFYLAWKAREHGVTTKFIEVAGEVNIRTPEYVIEKLVEALNERTKPVKDSKILVLGLAYKKDIDDPRESPSFEIIDSLLRLGADVSYHDPLISNRAQYEELAGPSPHALDRSGHRPRAFRCCGAGHRPLRRGLRQARGTTRSHHRYPRHLSRSTTKCREGVTMISNYELQIAN